MLSGEPNILWPEVTKFIGQLNHDLRNHLNAVELQAAFLDDIMDQPEARAEIRRLREMTRAVGAHLQKLAATLAKIRLQTMRYPAAVNTRLDEVFNDLLENGPTAEEVARVATSVASRRIQSLEQVNGKASVLAEGQLYSGDPDHYKTELAAGTQDIVL